MNSRSGALLLVLLTLTVLGPVGCVRVSTGAVSPTLGEQVVELARAKELGALTEEEYQVLRRKVLASF